MSSTPLALFVGLPNPTISDDEFALFRETNPLGLFVGRRNQREPEQTRRLIERFREAVGRDDAPVFTDQEGGRVQHLDAGPWPLFRSFGQFAELARRDFDLGKKALRLSSQAMISARPSYFAGAGQLPRSPLRPTLPSSRSSSQFISTGDGNRSNQFSTTTRTPLPLAFPASQFR